MNARDLSEQFNHWHFAASRVPAQDANELRKQLRVILGQALDEDSLPAQAESAALIRARVRNPMLCLYGQRRILDEECCLHVV